MSDICPICQSDCFPFANRFLNDKLLRCKNCGLIFVWPQPKFNDLKKIYGHHYFENNDSNSTGYENYLIDRPNITKTFEKRLKKIQEHIENGSILDLGCASGFFLEVAGREGFTPYGVEISNYASQIAKKNFGNKIFTGTLEESNFQEGFFDVVTMWDYIEHLTDPFSQLKKIGKILSNDGLLVLTTPDTESWPHKIFKQKWMGYKKGEHLFYFSNKNLSLLLEKSGFKIIRKEKVGKYIPLKTLIQRLKLYNVFFANFIGLIFKIMGLTDFSFYINPGDIVCIYAKKSIQR